MPTPSFVWDSSVNKSILAFYNSVGLPVFMDETTGLPVDVIDRDARILGRTKIHDGTNVLDVLIQDSAFGVTAKGLALFGKYQVTPTAYTDGDATPILLDANGRIVLASDIQIGAVELKDGDTDNRANIKAASTARTTATLVVATQPIDAAGAVLSTSALATAAKQDLQPMAATTPTLYAVTMTLANTEYSQALPAGTKILEFRCRATGYDVRFAYVTGKVAAPVDPYRTLSAGQVKTLDILNLAAGTLYVACGTAGQIAEIEVWT